MSAAEQDLFLARPGEIELLIRKSRFLGFAHACTDTAAARDRLAALRLAHPKANHHVYAWRLRAAEGGQLTHKYDDDGEPGGTAGRPVLLALESRSVVNAQVVVVRYFGGVKLGAGGLVRAYGETAAKALDRADLRPLIPVQTLAIRVPFNHLAAVERLIVSERLTVTDRDFAQDARLVVKVPVGDHTRLKQMLTDLTHGAVLFK